MLKGLKELKNYFLRKSAGSAGNFFGYPAEYGEIEETFSPEVLNDYS